MDDVDKLVLIDYETCCFVWRGSDIGQHFHDRTVDVTAMTGEIDPKSSLEYPTEDERRYFIQEYLDEVEKLGTYQIDPELDSVETLLIEAEYFGLLWNMVFLMWLVRDHVKLSEKGFGGPGHLHIFLGNFVKTLKDRKERFLDLKTRYPDHNKLA